VKELHFCLFHTFHPTLLDFEATISEQQEAIRMHTAKEHATVLSRMRGTCTITIMGAITRSQTRRARTNNEDQSLDAPSQETVTHAIRPFCPKETHVLDGESPATTVNAYLKALNEAYTKIRVAPKEVCSKNARQNKWEELGDKKEDFGMASSVVKGAKGRGFMCLVATPDTGVYEKSHAAKNAPSDWSPERREQYVATARTDHFAGDADWHCTVVLLYAHTVSFSDLDALAFFRRTSHTDGSS
jgi:hypothetical protein